jgi:SAM-dependent methyltransferase
MEKSRPSKRPIETVHLNCYLCGSSENVLVASGVDREYYTTDDVFHVVECVKCGLRFLNPRPTVAELDTIYPPDYYSYNMDSDPADLGLALQLRHKVHGRRIRSLLSHLDNRPQIDLLDVGCGDGWMLYLFKLADPKRIRTFGVDINEKVCAAARSRGHTVYCGLFEDVQFDQQFDVINLSNVIEHVTDPVGVVKKAYASLRSGGILILETPNNQSWDARWFSDGAWGSYHIPRHFTFFNPSTIQKLGATAGFDMVEVRYTPAPTQWVWTLHNVLLGRAPGIGRRLAPIFEPRDCFSSGLKPLVLLSSLAVFDWLGLKITGQTSNMTVVFQKTGRAVSAGAPAQADNRVAA